MPVLTLTTRRLILAALALVVASGMDCPNFQPADLPGLGDETPPTGVILRLDNQSGQWAEVNAVYHLAGIDVRTSRILLEPTGPDAQAEIVSTVANEINVEAVAASSAGPDQNADAAESVVLASQTYMLNRDFVGGETLTFVIPSPQGPAGDIIDCNNNGVADALDIASATSNDCDNDGVPDDCEPDADSDGTINDCDLCPADPLKIVPGVCGCGVADVDGDFDGVLDCDDVCPGFDDAQDCNGNSVPDGCDIADFTSPDCNLNGVPDECDLLDASSDCNNNSIPDECEIDAGSTAPGGPFYCTSACADDCNDNGLPDECDVVDSSPDCNKDGIPDECQLAGNDCNNNGQLDECDLYEQLSTDCNANNVPDECDLAADDCDGSGVPDACEVAPLSGPFSNPLNLDNNVNDSDDQCEGAVSPDGLTLRFDAVGVGGYGGRDLWEATRTYPGDIFGPPVNLGAALNTASNEQSPASAAGDLELYFSSDRAGALGGLDLFVAARTATTQPFNAPSGVANVNSPADDTEPTLSGDGLRLIFASNRPGAGGHDLYEAVRTATTQPFGAPTPLAALNGADDERSPGLSAGGLVLVFSSNRPGGLGGYDLWIAVRPTPGDSFGAPINLGWLINSPADDTGPAFSAFGLELFFASNRAGGWGNMDLWVAFIADCNQNSVPDYCDILGGASFDTNYNFLPDECEPSGPFGPSGPDDDSGIYDLVVQTPGGD